MKDKPDPQTLETAITAASNAHTVLHQAIHELRHGSTTQAKQIIARQIAILANALIIL